jgi:hypothetical protein
VFAGTGQALTGVIDMANVARKPQRSPANDEVAESEVSTKQSDDNIEISWSDYPHVEPGEYRAYCRVAKTYFDVRFKRWTCLLRFDLLSNDSQRVLAERIPFWLSLGYGEKPHASRGSRYFATWLDANGGHKPRRSDRLSHRIFLRRICRVRVADSESKTLYSKVREILSWETGMR